MISLEGNKIWYVALFCETDSHFSSSVDSDEDKCRNQNAEEEVTDTSNEISFLIGLRTDTGRFICYNSKFI